MSRTTLTWAGVVLAAVLCLAVGNVFFAGAQAEDALEARVVLFDPRQVVNMENLGALQSTFVTFGMEASIVDAESDVAAALIRGQVDALIMYRPNADDPSDEFIQGALLPYLEKGGMVIISSSHPGVPAFMRRSLGDAGAVEWVDTGVPSARGQVWAVEGAWQHEPYALGEILNDRPTPLTLYRPVSEAWEVLAGLPMPYGEELPFLLRLKVGSGALVLTSANLGTTGGWVMLGSRRPEETVMLVANMLAEFKGE